jgi:hypothetical protein
LCAAHVGILFFSRHTHLHFLIRALYVSQLIHLTQSRLLLSRESHRMAFCFFFLSQPTHASFLSRQQPYAGSHLGILLLVYIGSSIPINMTLSFISAGISFAQPTHFFSMPAHTFLSRLADIPTLFLFVSASLFHLSGRHIHMHLPFLFDKKHEACAAGQPAF